MKIGGLSLRLAPAPAHRPRRGVALTPRELDVARLLFVGLTYKEIGRELGVTAKTVETYCGRIFERTATHSRAEAVYALLLKGVLRLPPRGIADP